MRLIFVLLFTFASISVYSQGSKRANVWYFGYNAGLDFNSGSPTLLTNGALRIWEGCATICDENGALLFYSDGRNAWNKNHRVIPGAENLGGDNSSSQSGIIVPYPGKPHLYYIFSVDAEGGSGGVQYALLDMNLNGGLGGLVSKNNRLLDRATEKLTAVRHCNNRDFWVVMHEINNNVFKSYLISDNGINANPIPSAVGSTHYGGTAAIGYMKASPDGKKLALANYGGFFEILNFDNQSGRISNPITLRRNEFRNAYGLEFSPDSKLLYISQTQGNPTIYQLDLVHTTSETLLTNMVSVGRTNVSYFGALQTGPDGKIYAAIDNHRYLAVINNPNVKGTGCDFTQNGFFLGNRESGLGLPNLITSYFIEPLKATIASKVNAAGCNDILLESTVTGSSTLTYQWFKDGQPIAGAQQATFKPTQSGQYQLKIETQDCVPQKAESNQLVIRLLELNPKSEAKVCGTFLLSAQATGRVEWSGPGISGARALQDTVLVTVTGRTVFKVKAFGNAGCVLEKEISVDYTAPGQYRLANKTQNVCGTATDLNAAASGGWNEFRWQLPNGSVVHQNPVKADVAGNYVVVARNSSTGCESRDTVAVVFINNLTAPVTQSFTICAGETPPTFTTAGSDIKWYNDSTLRTQIGSGPTFKPAVSANETGFFTYFLTQTAGSGCVSAVGKARLQINESPGLNLRNKTFSACFADAPGTLVTMDAGESPNAVYRWTTRDGSVLGENRVLEVQQPGSYVITVTNALRCARTDSVLVVESCQPLVFLPDVFTPNGDGVNDQLEVKGKPGSSLKLTVYNRWGEVLHQTDTGQWNGTYQNQPCSEGVYYWKLEATFMDSNQTSQTVRRSGQVLLAR